jgi:ubiquinone/menaquinone biosynthesis C-methylase UbiE
MSYDPRNYWNDVADAVATRGSGSQVAGYDSPLDRYERKRFVRQFVSVPVAGKDVMEVGSGSGLNLQLLDRGGARSITAVDVSERMLAIARENNRDARAEMRFLHIDGRAIPLPDASVDFVFTVTVLQHNSDPVGLASLMGEIARVARQRVYLFEDTARRERGSPEYMLRPVSFYRSFFEARGYRMVERQPSNLFVTRKVLSLFNRMTGLYSHREGAATARFAARLQYPLIPITFLLDNLIRWPEGNTMMVFERTQLQA